MNALRYGLTPKMKPISPRRSALVAALDVGSSKVVCLIARLRPHGPQQVLTRRSHAIEVIGFGHTDARGMKAGSVVNLAQAEDAIRQAVDAAERMAARRDRVGRAVALGRPARQRTVRRRHRHRRLRRIRRRYRARAGRRQPPFAARRPRRPAFASGRLTRSTASTASAIRAACSARGSASHMHVATTDVAAARNLMLAVERGHLDVEAMVASPYVAGLAVLADDEADLGAAVVDMGAGTTTMAVFLGGRLRSSRRFRAGRPSRHHGHRPRAQRPHRRRRANQDALWQCAHRGIG